MFLSDHMTQKQETKGPGAPARTLEKEKEGRTAREWFDSGKFPKGVRCMSRTFEGNIRMKRSNGSVVDHAPDEVVK